MVFQRGTHARNVFPAPAAKQLVNAFWKRLTDPLAAQNVQCGVLDPILVKVALQKPGS
jgi:hypothetical protein